MVSHTQTFRGTRLQTHPMGGFRIESQYGAPLIWNMPSATTHPEVVTAVRFSCSSEDVQNSKQQSAVDDCSALSHTEEDPVAVWNLLANHFERKSYSVQFAPNERDKRRRISE